MRIGSAFIFHLLGKHPGNDTYCDRYNPHPRESFFGTLLDHCYNLPVEETCPRRLGLLFMILAIAVLVDLRRKPYSPVAETYHTVARASLCEIPVMEHTNVETILALFYEIWYLLVFSDQKKAAGYAWGLMGLTSKLAQSVRPPVLVTNYYRSDHSSDCLAYVLSFRGVPRLTVAQIVTYQTVNSLRMKWIDVEGD